jgi:molybdenum cofactor cytidylyltransferase
VSAPPAAGLILAAGASTRFGGDKLAAPLRGRPILQHVLDAAAEAGLRPVVLVTARQRTDVQLHGARPVVNPYPARGLSSSLALGLAALAEEDSVERAVVLLGDQPLVSVQAIRQLVAVPADAQRPLVVPRYEDGQPGNPVRLDRSAWPMAAALQGDRGMSQLFAARADLVRHVDVAGFNPDVDTPADLAALE